MTRSMSLMYNVKKQIMTHKIIMLKINIVNQHSISTVNKKKLNFINHYYIH